jgi:CRP-like cAMP-binding protein
MFVREIEIFDGIASHIIDEIAELAAEETFPSGHVLFRKGDVADYLYILEDGAVNLTIHGQGQISFPLNQLGQVLDWSALVEPNRHTATAECVKDSKVTKIDGGLLMRILEKHPREGMTVMRRLAGVIATRLVKSHQEVIKIFEALCGSFRGFSG